MKLSFTLRFLFLLVSICSLRQSGWAQNDSLVIHLKNGNRVTIALSEIQRITFDSLKSSVEPLQQKKKLLNFAASYPNPSDAEVKFEFEIAEQGTVSISILDAIGKIARTLTSPSLPPGKHQVSWNGLDERLIKLRSGSYFYEVRFKDEVQLKRMILLE